MATIAVAGLRASDKARALRAQLNATIEQYRRSSENNSVCCRALCNDGVAEIMHGLAEIDAINREQDRFSYTTPRFRSEILQYLLDNPARGPIVEVGTMHGGTTVLFAFIGALTGRKVFALDIDLPRLEMTRDTCDQFGLLANVELRHSALDAFLSQEHARSRLDLLFIDSDHSYNVTIHELRALHGGPERLPRALVLHNLHYRVSSQEVLFYDRLDRSNPIAVDRAVFDFYSQEYPEDLPAPYFKRIGAASGDGTISTRSSQGGLGDFVQDHGHEGLMIFYPMEISQRNKGG